MTPTEFKARFPEFSSETDDRVQLFINDADPLFDQARWDDLYPVGLANLVAHELVVANEQTAAAGKISRLANDTLTKKVGDVQVGKDTMLLNKQAENPYMRTSYGQKYLNLRKLVGMGGVAV